jgi:hypothetical protein
METSASFEARSAPSSYPTCGRSVQTSAAIALVPMLSPIRFKAGLSTEANSNAIVHQYPPPRVHLVLVSEVQIPPAPASSPEWYGQGSGESAGFEAALLMAVGIARFSPIRGGFGITGGGGGYCHATFRLKEGRVAEVRYSGETNATLAPDAYCAPIVSGCLNQPERADTSPSITPQATPRADRPH